MALPILRNSYTTQNDAAVQAFVLGYAASITLSNVNITTNRILLGGGVTGVTSSAKFTANDAGGWMELNADLIFNSTRTIRSGTNASNLLKIDPGSEGLYDTGGVKSVDWGTGVGSKILRDVNGTTSVQWGGRLLFSSIGFETFDWDNGLMISPADNVTAIIWRDRVLKNSGNNTTLDWENLILSDQWSADATNFTDIQAANLSGTVAAINGGTDQSTVATGDMLYGSATNVWSRLADIATGNALISGGVATAPAWGKIGLTTHVSGTLDATNGGTGTATVTTGDILYGSATNVWSKLAGVATGNALISGGVTTAPAWGKIALTTHVSGVLPVANGGSGTSTVFTAGSIIFAGASGVYSEDTTGLVYDSGGDRMSIGSASFADKVSAWGTNPSQGCINAAGSRAARFGLATAANAFITGSVADDAVFASSNGSLLYMAGNAVLKFTSAGRVSFATSGVPGTITAMLHLPAGAAAASSAPLKFTSGTNLTTAEAGAMEYNGTNLFFTRSGTTRENVVCASAVTTEVLVSDTSVTVNISGTTYKLLARA